jgi:hypothetical protein
MNKEKSLYAVLAVFALLGFAGCYYYFSKRAMVMAAIDGGAEVPEPEAGGGG